MTIKIDIIPNSKTDQYESAVRVFCDHCSERIVSSDLCVFAYQMNVESGKVSPPIFLHGRCDQSFFQLYPDTKIRKWGKHPLKMFARLLIEGLTRDLSEDERLWTIIRTARDGLDPKFFGL